MAGIGFELRKILEKDTLMATARAHVLGGIIVLGPFICSVLCLLSLNQLSARGVQFNTRQTFASIVVYIFGGSLVATGPLQVILTRYLADKVYRGEQDTLIESLFPVLALDSALLAVCALPIVAMVDISTCSKILLVTLNITVGSLWVVVVFVRAAHGHRAVALIFLVGSVAALGLAAALGERFQLEGLLFGYIGGQVILLLLLIRHLIAEFGYPHIWDWGVLSYIKLFPRLLIIGLFTNLGIWIDKFIFWGSELRLETSGLSTAPRYDSSTFLAYLTVLPAFVVFFVRVETDFHDRFHGYYDEIFFRSSFSKIAQAARVLRASLIKALVDILKVQTILSFLAILFATKLLNAAGLPVSQIGMIRFGILGSLFMAFMIFSNVILLYLDAQREVMYTTLVFFTSDLLLTLLSLRLGYPFYGSGLAAASLLGMLASLFFLANQLYNLEYMTFGLMPTLRKRSLPPSSGKVSVSK